MPSNNVIYTEGGANRQPCTPQHPGYKGNLPTDPQDQDIYNLVGDVPYIGGVAQMLLDLGGFRAGGPVCVERTVIDNSTDNRTSWSFEIVAAIVFGVATALLIGVTFYSRIKTKS